MITLHPDRWRYLEGGEIEEGLVGEHLDVLAILRKDDRPRELHMRLQFRDAPARAVTVACVADPDAAGEGFLASFDSVPFTVEIRQAHGESPEMEFLADRTALLFQRHLGGLLEHGESGREFRFAAHFESYLLEKVYSWPAHLQRRLRHRFGIAEQHFESNIEIDGEPVDLALFPPRVEHLPEHAIWVFRLVDTGDRQARRRFKRLLTRRTHLRRGILIAGDGLRCYERRIFPDGPVADRVPFADLGLTPDASFGLLRESVGPDAFHGAPLGMRSFLEAFGSEITDRSFLVLRAGESGGTDSLAELLRRSAIPAQPLEGGAALLDFDALVRLRRLSVPGAPDLAFVDVPSDVEPPPITVGEILDPPALLDRVGGRFLYVGQDGVLLTVHVRDSDDALRLCGYALRRYLRYYRPDQAEAAAPPVEILAGLSDLLEQRYLILPEAGPVEEAGSIALDLYEGRRLWKAGSHGSPERLARVLYEPETGRWSVRLFTV